MSGRERLEVRLSASVSLCVCVGARTAWTVKERGDHEPCTRSWGAWLSVCRGSLYPGFWPGSTAVHCRNPLNKTASCMNDVGGRSNVLMNSMRGLVVFILFTLLGVYSSHVAR